VLAASCGRRRDLARREWRRVADRPTEKLDRGVGYDTIDP
jgi:hypothetical protein